MSDKKYKNSIEKEKQSSVEITNYGFKSKISDKMIESNFDKYVAMFKRVFKKRGEK